MQGKEVIKAQREIGDRNECAGDQDLAQRFRQQRGDNLVDLDVLQQPEQGDAGNRHDQQTDRDADPVPVEPLADRARDDARHVWHGLRATSIDADFKRIADAVSQLIVTTLLQRAMRHASDQTIKRGPCCHTTET